jgi:hypothetical protein
MKPFAPLAIACAIAISAGVALAQDYGNMIYAFSIRDGETLVLRRVTTVTNGCESMFVKAEGVDVLEGPSELSFKLEPGLVRTAVAGKDCPKPVSGTVVYVSAKNVKEPKDQVVTIRVRMETTNGPWQSTIRTRILIFPAPAGEPSPVASEAKQ